MDEGAKGGGVDGLVEVDEEGGFGGVVENDWAGGGTAQGVVDEAALGCVG